MFPFSSYNCNFLTVVSVFVVSITEPPIPLLILPFESLTQIYLVPGVLSIVKLSPLVSIQFDELVGAKNS